MPFLEDPVVEAQIRISKTVLMASWGIQQPGPVTKLNFRDPATVFIGLRRMMRLNVAVQLRMPHDESCRADEHFIRCLEA